MSTSSSGHIRGSEFIHEKRFKCKEVHLTIIEKLKVTTETFMSGHFFRKGPCNICLAAN